VEGDIRRLVVCVGGMLLSLRSILPLFIPHLTREGGVLLHDVLPHVPDHPHYSDGLSSGQDVRGVMLEVVGVAFQG